METIDQCLSSLFLEWHRNFISYGKFAIYYGMTEKQAKIVISMGRVTHYDSKSIIL